MAAYATGRRIAFISEHASPLGNLGGTDGGGQNVYVSQLAKQVAALGYHVDVFTRRDRPELPEVMEWVDGVRVVHVPAGPASFVRKEDMLPLMGEFRDWMLAFFDRTGQTYDLVHANFFMSALVAADIKQATGIPFVVTFHAFRPACGGCTRAGQMASPMRALPSKIASSRRPTRWWPSARRTRRT